MVYVESRVSFEADSYFSSQEICFSEFDSSFAYL
jgi:hypothetical protein